jgi:uncharacterized tellurite resistance protein B-like protein
MEETEKLLKDFTNDEKGAYLGAIASLATADHSASPEEIEFLETLADSAGVSPQQRESVVKAATEISGKELSECIQILKNSDLRFSLLTDLISFAKSDNHYSDEEKRVIKNMADELKISDEQFSLLDQFVDKAATSDTNPEDSTKPGFLESLGLGEKFKNAGIDWKNVGKGLLAVAGPIILGKMLAGRNRTSRPSSSSGLGGLAGGLGGGLGSLLGGASNTRSGMGGGLGSLISSLSGGRGFGASGGLLSRIFSRR